MVDGKCDVCGKPMSTGPRVEALPGGGGQATELCSEECEAVWNGQLEQKAAPFG